MDRLRLYLSRIFHHQELNALPEAALA
jgi:hypothetical protein